MDDVSPARSNPGGFFAAPPGATLTPVFSPQTSQCTVAARFAYEDERLGYVGRKCPVCPPVIDIGWKATLIPEPIGADSG